MDTLLNLDWLTIFAVVSSVIAGSSIIVRAISKVTDNTTDDRLAKFLARLETWLSKLALNTDSPDARTKS